MTKPLTDAEVAELRGLLREHDQDRAEHFSSDLSWIAVEERASEMDALPRLLDEVGRARALLRRIEWGGPEGLETDCCPSCGGEAHLHLSQPKRLGHREGCELAALLSVTVAAH